MIFLTICLPVSDSMICRPEPATLTWWWWTEQRCQHSWWDGWPACGSGCGWEHSLYRWCDPQVGGDPRQDCLAGSGDDKCDHNLLTLSLTWHNYYFCFRVSGLKRSGMEDMVPVRMGMRRPMLRWTTDITDLQIPCAWGCVEHEDCRESFGQAVKRTIFLKEPAI